MPKKDADMAAEYQQDYRKKQRQKGMIRYEIQIPEKLKAELEQLAGEAAEERAKPKSFKRRMTQARAQIFEEITTGVRHEFFELKDRIRDLQQQVTALSPSFFKTDKQDNAPIPDAINTLPDDTKKLKRILATIYKESQSAKLERNEFKRRANQYLNLYEVSDRDNERLRKILKEEEIPFE